MPNEKTKQQKLGEIYESLLDTMNELKEVAGDDPDMSTILINLKGAVTNLNNIRLREILGPDNGLT